jgi:uncharacterized protein DUF4126
MDILTAVLTAIGLAACAGLRAFLPIFGAGLAARVLGWPLPSGLDSLASDTGLLIFGVATLIELAADKIPMIDHALDAIHTVIGPIAGILLAYIPFSHLPLPYALALAIMTGATVAGGVHTLAAATRVKSSILTISIANPLLSVIEDLFAITTLAVTILAPILLLLPVVAGILWIRRRCRARALG